MLFLSDRERTIAFNGLRTLDGPAGRLRFWVGSTGGSRASGPNGMGIVEPGRGHLPAFGAWAERRRDGRAGLGAKLNTDLQTATKRFETAEKRG